MDSNPSQLFAGFFCFSNVGVYDYRLIIFQSTHAQYVGEMAASLAEGLGQLVEHFAEEVNLSELESFHESWLDEPYPEDGWGWLDVQEFLKGLPERAIREFEKTGDPRVLTSRWYENSVGWLNDVFPKDCGVWVAFEGPMDEFLPELLDEYAQGDHQLAKLSNARAQWLGRIAVLSKMSWRQKPTPETAQMLYKLFKEFDERNA